MHSFYEKNKEKYNKDILKLLSYIKPEATESFHTDFEAIVNNVQNIFMIDFLPDIPYVGGKKNPNDTANMVGCCEYAAFFSTGMKQGLSIEQLGYLLHLAESRRHRSAPKFIQVLVRKFIGLTIMQKILVKMAEKSQKYAKEYPYAWVYEYEAPDETYSHKLNCTRCGACKFIQEKGLGDIMPYVCNIDFVAFGSFGLPYYRDEVIAYGDSKCSNLFKRGAKVVTDNWPPHGIRGDGLK